MRREGPRWCSAAVGVALAVLGCGESVRHEPSRPAEASDPRARRGQILVVDGFGLPYANMPVLVDDAVVTTDDTGYATLPNVGASYDVSVIAPPIAYTFLGLTTRAPVVVVTATTNGNGASSVSLHIELPSELDVDQTLVYSAGFSDYAQESMTWSASNAQGIVVSAYWPGTSPTPFSAEAFTANIDYALGAKLEFSQYASGTFTVAPGDALTWVPQFAPIPFQTKPIHVAVTLPPGASITSYSADGDQQSGRMGPAFGANPSSGGDISVLDLPDTTYFVNARAAMKDGRREFIAQAEGVRAGDRVNLEVSDAPLQVAPEDGAVVTPDTDFTWTRGPEIVDMLWLSAGGPSGRVTYEIATARGRARIPDLSALGMPFPAGDSLGWLVESFPGSPSVDAYAAGRPSLGRGTTELRRATAAAP